MLIREYAIKRLSKTKTQTIFALCNLLSHYFKTLYYPIDRSTRNDTLYFYGKKGNGLFNWYIEPNFVIGRSLQIRWITGDPSRSVKISRRPSCRGHSRRVQGQSAKKFAKKRSCHDAWFGFLVRLLQPKD